MGRSKKQQPQNARDYSNKPNQLRKQQELSSSTSWRPSASSTSKLNAVMQMDPPGSRRRVARNPIAEQHQQQDSLSPTPADADSSNDAASSGGGGAAGECRRSSRKKTIKFDVRDLLNKTRKNHKIQIEARIDSNAPTNKTSGTGAASSRAELDSKQKNFIEKSAIFRRYSISENKLPPRPPPPPGALIHTIQQCVGELEQLPLAESGELNLAAISPIARRLSRTQDILTASMIKPKQVSSLIVTKLESASTAKAATSSTAVEAKSMPTRRRAAERCEPSTSNAATAKNKQQMKVVQKRGRKPKAKVFDEPSTKPDLFSICTSSSPSSSIDGYATHIPVAENGNEPIETVNSSDSSDNSTTGIDLKENLDASAVTLPLPTIPADDCARNSSDESIAATEEDTFSIQNLSSDESIASSSKGMKANDEISLFGRSNSTDTTSSDNSEKRQRKVRIAVKRVSLTPQFLQSPSMSPHYPQSPQSPGLPQSPLGSSSEEPPPPKEGDTVDPQSTTNDDVSNDKATEAASSSSISALKQFKENMPLVEASCTTPAVATDGDTTSVDSSVVETAGLNEVFATATIMNFSVPKRRGRSKANKEQLATATTDMPNTQEQFPFKTKNRSSSARRQIHQQPTETLTASITPAKSLEVVAQPLAQEVASSATYTPSDDTSLIQNQKPRSPKSPSEETGPVKNDSNDANSTAVPKTRSLRSAQNNLESLPQLTLPTRQRKSNKVSSPVIEHPPAAENNAKADVSPVLDNSSQIEIESAQELIAEEKITRSRASKKKLDQGDPVLTDKNQTIPAKDGLSTSADKKETNISKPEGESTTDRSSTDETASSDRRESPRLRSSASLAMTKIIPNKVFTAVSSSTPDSESSAESTDGREKSSKTKTLNKTKPITNSEKVSEENSGMCSESSSITSSSTSTSSGSSTSSSSISASDASSKSSAGTSSSTSSSSSGSSSSTSSTSSEGRSTRSSKEEARKSPLKSAVLDRVKSSARSDSECSEKSSTSEDMRFKKLETLSQRRKTARLERLNRWSSEGSESSCSTVSRTRSDGSKGRVEDTNSPKDETPIANKTNESVPETPLENSSHATSQPRSKSKKRTRRFIPIKYSSSESGSLSDDNLSSRMTRTRRKTISSASDFDELPSNNLKPPDLALEYLPRRSKLGMAKSQADLSKIGTDDEAIKPRRSRSKKGMRNSSRCRSQSTVAPKSDLTLKDTKGVQEINDYSQPASSTSSASSYSSSSTEETQTKDLPQRKITRLSLKNQNSDSGNSESQTKNTNSDSNNDHVSPVMPTLVPDCEETIKDDGKVLECKSQAGQIIVEPENSTSQIKSPESEASNSVKSSPKHKKATKSNREKSEGDTIDEASGIYKEKDQDHSVHSDPTKENIEEPPSNFRRITRLSPKNLEVVTAEAKSNEKPVEKEEPEVIKKVTRSSLKRIEIIVNSSPDTIKEKTSDSEDFVSIPDQSKEQVEISPKAREVGTISPKSTEEQQKQFDEVLQDLEVPSPGLRSKATSHSTTNQQEEEPKQLDDLQAVDRVSPEKTIQEVQKEPKEIPLESEKAAEEQKVCSPSPGSKTKQLTPKQQEKESKQVDNLQSDEKATAVEQPTLISLDSAVQEPVSVESPKRKRQSTRAAAATKSPTKPKTEGKKEQPNAVDKTSDDLNSVPTIQTPANDQIVKVPRQLRKMTRFSPRVPENTQAQQDESMVEKLTLENETEKNDVQPLAESAELREQENATRETETNRTLPTAVVEVSSDNLQNEKDQKQTIDDCRVQEPVPSIQAIEVQAVKTRARKGTRFSPLVTQTTIHEITKKSTEIEVPQKMSEGQVVSTTESPNSSSLPPVLKPQDSNPTEDDVVPKRDAIELPPSASNSSPQSKKSDYASKKVIKQQLQSMLDSLTLVGSKTTPPKETTPRRKKKTLTPVAALPSSDSNQSNEPMKQTQEEPTQKIDQKPATPRRKLDSSFIESLEKSLLRSAKKASKKKEKDKAAIAQILTPTPTTKEESSTKKSTSPTNSTTPKPIEQCEELKKPVETPSPKLKKKQPKESPKPNKKLEDQNQAKRKNLEKTKKSEESSFANIFKDVAAVTTHPQPPKTKAETKFFSPGKSSIEYEPPSPPQSQPPVVQDVSPQLPVEVVKEKSPDLIPDPLKDIEKFIEDGVNLLKRTYKIDADDDASLDRDILKPDDIMTPKKCKLDENVVETASTPTANSQDTSPPDDDNSNSNSECSNLTSLTNTSTSEIDTPNGIRRSHRIKNNSKSTKCLVGRGLVRERERFSTKDDEKTIYSIDDQKMDLAEVEAKNSKFLKDMEERLSNFRVIRENEYKCERVISKEAKRMLCDCFLTVEEEERGELGCGEDCLNRLLMIECGTDCTVRERCTNRRFNKFLYSPCRVFRTEKKGFGIMADIEILPGEFIMEYVGEVINGDEFEIRINEYSKDKNKHYYFMALRSDAVIDATAKGNISRFINHSCDPNAETQKWTVNGELRIGFFSRKSIMPGEEITFDYQYQRYGKEAQRCYCESSNCRGWIGAEPSSEEEEEEEVDEEDESEETEEEEPTGAVAPVLPVIPSPIPLDVPITDAEKNLIAPTLVAGAEVSAIAAAGEVDKPPQPVLDPSVPSPTPTTPAPTPTPTVPDMLKPPTLLPKKTKKEKKRLHEEKLKRREPKQFLEDPDIEDEVRFLVKCGLRNQADTLRLSRLIVRAKLLETRIKLLQILRKAELPCRRLFLDYHGLRLLHGWMSEVIDTRNSEENLEIRMELLSVLECLPIPNKTMLNDSKVYYTVRDWSNNKESHSPSDRSPKESNSNSSEAPAQPMSTEAASSELQKLAAKLVHTWNNLPEVFRIPKRERIEQMKEHEREADRQYKDFDRDSADRNRNRERFVSKNGKKGRFKWSKEKERDRANDRRKFAQNSSNSGKDCADKSSTLAGGDSHLSKEQRRELFAAKVARDEAEKRLAEERREFDIKCRFFGLDPKRIRPENMPFCVNPSTGQWFSTDRKPIATPPSYAHVQVPVKPKSTNPQDYRLPPMDLPPLWKFAISPKGKIYYYHVKIRIPQWEPPIKILPLSGQNDAGSMKNSESDSSNTAPNESSEDDIEVIKGLDPVKLQAYIEKRIENRRLQRYTRLVEEKPISPRKEEDRIYNQMEVRKYKENKEKIRKRKEEIRKRRDIIGLPPAATVAAVESSTSTNATETTAKDGAEPLPIQDYLLSSEEEELLKAECNNSPLIDKIVQGDKIVDELDALHRKRSLKRALPIRDKYDHKKRKQDKNKESSKSTKRSKDGEGSSSSSSSSKYRKVREKFRCEIAGIIVQHLKPYRGETCSNGRILTDDDFNHLARKLTHFVMVKELKYCESVGQTLIVTESVKNKSREFIKKYMAKYGKVYVRPKNDPEFKDIPFL